MSDREGGMSITTEEEYEAAEAELHKLLDKKDPTDEDNFRIVDLSDAIEEYENERYGN